MYYSSGSCEAFARPRKPEGVENKHACLVGAGLASLAAAGFLIRDGQMPFITAFFMPRTVGDRPQVVPEHVTNFAFLGQFAETVRDTIFTTEYSVSTDMEAVYQLLDVERGAPEVWGGLCLRRAGPAERDCLHARRQAPAHPRVAAEEAGPHDRREHAGALRRDEACVMRSA